MLDIVISFLTFVLILVSLFMVLVILMQRANTNAGMGSAFGGGVTESAFGADTTNILTRATKWAAVGFFLIALTLYLLYMHREGSRVQPVDSELPDIPVPAVSEELPEPPSTPSTAPADSGIEPEPPGPGEETSPAP